MKLARWIGLVALSWAIVQMTVCHPACAQTVMLADWEVPPNPSGATHVGEDFDPQLDSSPSCSGCWYAFRPGTTPTTYSQSTGAGATSGTHALQATLVGKGNGGMYSPMINGVAVELDTHFDNPLVATYSNTTNPAAGGPDPRFTAIKNAVDGVNPGSFYTIEFDITYDAAQMRSIPWQPPEETVDPENNGRFPQRFFWIGMYGNANEPEGFTFVGFDANTINPFDAQWDNNLLPVFHASFPLDDFTFQPNSATTFYQFGFLYNSVFGTLPASSNTTGVHIYFDNLRLVEHDPTDECDFNNDNACTLADFQLFMAQHLVEAPTLGDYDGDEDNDFQDFQEFEKFYDLANLGSGTLRSDLAGVPELGSMALVGLLLAGLSLSRAGRARHTAAALLVAAAFFFAQHTAEAQLVETFTTLGNWQATAGAPPPSNPSVSLSAIGATDGPTSLKVTQAEDTIGGDDFIWAAGTNPNWSTGHPAFELLRNAVSIGAEHYNLLVDVTFEPADLPAVNSLAVTFGLNFVGQGAGLYSGETERFTTTTTIPLTAFNLPDVEDEGATSYSAQIGFTADAINLPFSAFIDNIRLEQISMPDLLTLEINRSNGAATLKNLTANPISWDYMEIKSAGASLDPTGWSSLDDQNAGGAGTWIEAGGSSPTALVEASLLSSHTLTPGAMLSLGNLYNEAINAEDVDLEIRREAGPSFRTYDQLVTYIGQAPAGVLGDYNDNGIVDAADYVLWRNGGPLQNEGDNPGTVNQADYNFWRSRFGATSGSGVGAGAAVPEPATLLLCICVFLAAFTDRQIRFI